MSKDYVVKKNKAAQDKKDIKIVHRFCSWLLKAVMDGFGINNITEMILSYNSDLTPTLKDKIAAKLKTVGWIVVWDKSIYTKGLTIKPDDQWQPTFLNKLKEKKMMYQYNIDNLIANIKLFS